MTTFEQPTSEDFSRLYKRCLAAEAEVASLTAIRERAQAERAKADAALDVNPTLYGPLTKLNLCDRILGDAASGSDCASGSDTNPSPEPLTDVYDLLTDEQRAALREDLAAIARTRQVGLGAAPSPEPPRRCPVTQFPCATCPGECESVLAWRAAVPAPKEER